MVVPYLLFSQIEDEAISGFSVEGKIIDRKNKEPIAYAAIYNTRTKKGTISNLEGYFKLSAISHSDSILITIIGYKQKYLQLNMDNDFYRIYLEENAALLDEVVIVADDNSYLHDLLHRCKKQRSKIKVSSKAYFELNSMVNDKRIELVECFYNTDIQGYDLEKLNLKTGRLAVQPYHDRFFASYESSRAITMLKLFNSNEYFPKTPLDISKRKSKKHYFLELTKKYKNDDLDSIYVIAFNPKDTLGFFFGGRIWVNYTKKQIIKINLQCANTNSHPFLPVGDDSIKNMTLDITKTFREVNGEMVFNHIDFVYQMEYQSKSKGTVKRYEMTYDITTNAVLHAYDFESSFILPEFQFSDDNIGDYKKISAIPYNDFFWENNDEFKLNDHNDRNRHFFNDAESTTNKVVFSQNSISQGGRFEHPFIAWSEKRIFLKELTTDTLTAIKKSAFKSDQYHLSVKLFMDINSYDDSIHVLTAAIIDPYETYYHLPLHNTTHCFINIYFDLFETERRKLEKEIQGSDKKIVTIQRIYNDYSARLEKLKQEYLKAVERGTNEKEMIIWNNYVFENLGINNVELFDIFKD